MIIFSAPRMKGVKENNIITTISSSEEEESVVAGYISEDCLSVIDEGETVGMMSIIRVCLWWIGSNTFCPLPFIIICSICLCYGLCPTHIPRDKLSDRSLSAEKMG